jgi:aspartyl protease family protein
VAAPHPSSPWGTTPAPRRPLWRRVAIIGVIALGIAAVVAFAGLPSAATADDAPYVVYLGIVGITLLLSSTMILRERLPVLLLRAGAWLGILLALLFAYDFRYELRDGGERLLALAVPSYGHREGDAAMSFRVASDGHYWVNAQVDGKPFRFMIDTGASGIVFSRSDARRLGLDPAALDYDRAVSTANGATRAATIRLRQLSVGPITLSDVPALVNAGELNQPLLGMRFLERLGSIEIKDGVLTLHR